MKPSCCDPAAGKSRFQRGDCQKAGDPVARRPRLALTQSKSAAAFHCCHGFPWNQRAPDASMLRVEARRRRRARNARKRLTECLRE